MKSFNVIWWDFNKSKPEPYDVIPYLVDCYNKEKNKPKTLREFKEFIKSKSMYIWWSKCEYEIIIKKWPSMKETVKWDIHKQVMMNIDLIADILMQNIDQ